MTRHYKLCDGVTNLARKTFIPMHVHDNPKIYTSRVMRGGKDKLNGSPSQDIGDMKGDLLIRDLWTQGMDIIHYTWVVNTDSNSYQSKYP